MFHSMPSEIKEHIMEFAGEKQQIKNHFLANIAHKIDPSLVWVSNQCEFCYIEILKTRKWVNCDACYQGLKVGHTKKKWFSATSLIAGQASCIGELYYALGDMHRFLFIMSLTDWTSNHPLSWLHYDLCRAVRRID